MKNVVPEPNGIKKDYDVRGSCHRMPYTLSTSRLCMVLFLPKVECMARGPRNRVGVAPLIIPPNNLLSKLEV